MHASRIMHVCCCMPAGHVRLDASSCWCRLVGSGAASVRLFVGDADDVVAAVCCCSPRLRGGGRTRTTTHRNITTTTTSSQQQRGGRSRQAPRARPVPHCCCGCWHDAGRQQTAAAKKNRIRNAGRRAHLLPVAGSGGVGDKKASGLQPAAAALACGGGGSRRGGGRRRHVQPARKRKKEASTQQQASAVPAPPLPMQSQRTPSLRTKLHYIHTNGGPKIQGRITRKVGDRPSQASTRRWAASSRAPLISAEARIVATMISSQHVTPL